jgi:hypothetical protein
MTQLCFLFVVVDDPPPAVSRTTLYWRKRINRAARAAFEIGRRQRRPVPKAPRPLRAAVVPAVSISRDRNELHELPARVARLTISRRDPECFHCEKSEISAALRAIARR